MSALGFCGNTIGCLGYRRVNELLEGLVLPCKKLLRSSSMQYNAAQYASRRILICCAVFGLTESFADRYAFLCIHMWLCLVRLRSEGKDGKQLAQVIYENFQEDVEMRVRAAGVKVCAFAFPPVERTCESREDDPFGRL